MIGSAAQEGRRKGDDPLVSNMNGGKKKINKQRYTEINREEKKYSRLFIIIRNKGAQNIFLTDNSHQMSVV